ncbi:MAG: tetratricopeptide repeat protein [Bacteroidetes bacterium]|nr:tetratricopeptide repeat protein [Bacteroidota bacterium]
MKPYINPILTVFACLLLLASCGPVTPIPPASATPPPSAVPTLTATLTPIATQTPVFPLPTMQPYLEKTPTAIATPQANADYFRLKRVNETRLAETIAWMQWYSIENFPYQFGWRQESEFSDSQQAVALLIQEYLYRFPNSSDYEQYLWQLAFISALNSSSDADSRIISAIQDSLDKGDIAPENLEDLLERYWFNVLFIRKVENLFGDGKTGWVYHITTQHWQESRYETTSDTEDAYSEEGMFLAIRENLDGRFEPILLASAWSKNTSHVRAVGDHNQNGIPEIVIYLGYHSGTMCSGNLLVYEWRQNMFVELTQDAIYDYDCISNASYTVVDGRPAIQHFFNMWMPVMVFAWNGEVYRFEKFVDATPFKEWLALRHYENIFGQESKLIKKILTSGDISRMGPGYPDYLRLRLGIVYALEGQYPASVSALKQLISSPQDIERDIFPRLAERFLELYKEPSDIYMACTGIQRMLMDGKNLPPNVMYTEDPETLRETFGIFDENPQDYGTLFPLCSPPREAFAPLINTIPATIPDFPTELQKRGISSDKIYPLDANLDGKNEWLVVEDSDLWHLVWSDDDSFYSDRLPIDYRWYYSDLDFSSVEIKVEKWQSLEHPVILISFGNQIGILEVGPGFETRWLLVEGRPNKFEIFDTKTLPIAQYTYFLPDKNHWRNPRLPLARYQWNPATQEFDEITLEYFLFTEQNPMAAVVFAEEIFPKLPAWEQSPYISQWHFPRFYYLTALSYELVGDESRAIELYWQLWRKFPDSHYARMAQLKLEPIP